MKVPPSAVSRRDLFRLRASRSRAGAENPVPTDRLNGGDLLKATRAAMGSYFEVRIPARMPGGSQLVHSMLDLVDALEFQMTIYRDDSELSRVNSTACSGPVEIEPRLFQLIERAIELSRDTGGAYDIATAALSEAWGFIRGPKRVPSASDLALAKECSGSEHVRLDAQTRRLTFDRPGVGLNLGSIGKGYTLDRMGELAQNYLWPVPALLHAGRSSLLALGSPPNHFGGRWAISVRNPFDPTIPLGVLHLRNQGLGTSGLAYQYFESGGQVFGHILDPRTGEPVQDGPASVTVVAPTATEADSLSTAFFLLGPERTAEYLEGRKSIGALFVLDSGADHSPCVRTINIPDGDWTPHDFVKSPGMA